MTKTINSEKENKDWEPTNNRFVAFIDILGFKNFINESLHSEVYEKMQKVTIMKELINKWEPDERNRFKNSEIFTITFSDSIVVFSKNDSIEDFDLFISTVNWIFNNLIFFLPVKGSLSYGEITVDKENQIFFGKPLIEAYELEGAVEYMGIVAHKHIEEYFYKNFNDSDYSKSFFEYNTPLKGGNKTHLNFEWFSRSPGKIKFLKNTIINHKDIAPEEALRYYDNTIEILNYFLQIYDVDISDWNEMNT